MVISLADRVKDAAVVPGMAGALLVTSTSPFIRAAGFGAWVIGNSCWICVGRASGDHHLILLFGFYLVTAMLGLWTAGGMI